jgi:multidrug efflux system membrane fusion protein
LLACALGAGLSIGCAEQAPPAAADDLPDVPVSRAVRSKVIDYVYDTGRTDAVQTVGVRPRVTAYLVKMPFKEGAEAKKAGRAEIQAKTR